MVAASLNHLHVQYRTKIIVVWWLEGAKTNAPEMQAMPQVMIGEDLQSFDNNAVRIDLFHVFPNLSLDGLIYTYLFSSLPYCTLVTKSKERKGSRVRYS